MGNGENTQELAVLAGSAVERMDDVQALRIAELEPAEIPLALPSHLGRDDAALRFLREEVSRLCRARIDEEARDAA